MASDRQIKANQENARRSTGPRTPLGKARASFNAVRHGLSARNAVLPQEDHQAYEELRASLEAQFQPEGAIETFLVQQMASAQWRLLRLARIETGFLMASMDEIKEAEAGHGYDYNRSLRPRPKSNLSEEDEITRLLGEIFKKHSGQDGFARLTRYENMLNAEYFRALRTLTALRNGRDKTNPIREAAVPPPPPRSRVAIPSPPLAAAQAPPEPAPPAPEQRSTAERPAPPVVLQQEG